MRVLIALPLIWYLKHVLAAILHDNTAAVVHKFDSSTKIGISDGPVSSTVLERRSGNKPLARDRNPSRQRVSSDSSSSSRFDPSQRAGGDASTSTRTDSDISHEQSSLEDRSRPPNRATRTLRDLVRSASPPQTRNIIPKRSASSSPPMVRRIRKQRFPFAHPDDRAAAKAAIGMIGPGYVTHVWPGGRQTRTAVPPKKMLVRGTDHPDITLLAGKVYSGGTMIASASGAKAVASLSLNRGYGVARMSNDYAEHFEFLEPQTNSEYWMQRLPGQQSSVTAEAYVNGGGAVTVIGCSDPNWCDDVWRRPRPPSPS